MRRRRTEADVERVGELHGSGLDDAGIGAAMGRTASAIRIVRMTHGYVRAEPPVWTTARTDELRRLHGLGRTDAEIAEALETTVWAVVMRRRRLGLPQGGRA